MLRQLFAGLRCKASNMLSILTVGGETRMRKKYGGSVCLCVNATTSAQKMQFYTQTVRTLRRDVTFTQTRVKSGRKWELFLLIFDT